MQPRDSHGANAATDAVKTKVFLSYSRKDREAVARIAKALEGHEGIQVFKDTEDILPTEEWRGRLEGLIGEADTIVFCLSPDSATSEVCAWEVEVAESLNKRIAPIVIRDVDRRVPAGLAKLNYILATARDDFDRAIGSLIAALDTNIVWIREHTRIGELARRWATNGELTDQLLRGRDLDAAEQWARFRPSNAPELTNTTSRFISASREEALASARRARRTKTAIRVLAILLSWMGIAWWYQDDVRQRFYWYLVMRSSVLTPEQEKEIAAKPGAVFKECGTGCPTMVVVPPGTFKMGERVQRDVSIAEAFAVGRTEVTFAEWDLCVAAGGCPNVPGNSWGRGERPVINVGWGDAKRYVTWLSRSTGNDYRLLTDAEWEYAARAGSSGRYAFGDDEARLGEYAWFKENANSTQPVGRKEPNAFGIQDMHGNVDEWVNDCATAEVVKMISGHSTTGTTSNAEGCLFRIFRGGAFDADSAGLQSSTRRAFINYVRNFNLGFRIARTLNR